jgi:hypothetical protein
MRIYHALFVKNRETAGCEASPIAAIIESQSVKGSEKEAARSTRPGMMQAITSGARSAISSSTRKVC